MNAVFFVGIHIFLWVFYLTDVHVILLRVLLEILVSAQLLATIAGRIWGSKDDENGRFTYWSELLIPKNMKSEGQNEGIYLVEDESYISKGLEFWLLCIFFFNSISPFNVTHLKSSKIIKENIYDNTIFLQIDPLVNWSLAKKSFLWFDGKSL